MLLKITQQKEHLSECKNHDKALFFDPQRETFANGRQRSQKARKSLTFRQKKPHFQTEKPDKRAELVGPPGRGMKPSCG